MHSPLKLGVNIDHVATLRQARMTKYPCLMKAAELAEAGGADGITIHLREDRRHIQDADVYALKESISTKLNLEMAATVEMCGIALEVNPQDVCIVPEKREELTTEGGLDVIANLENIKAITGELQDKDICVSLFIDPEIDQIDATVKTGAKAIELHTGTYADSPDPSVELSKIKTATDYAHQQGLITNAGHGLHYDNVKDIAKIPHMNELNIGHFLIAQACFDSLQTVVAHMKTLMHEAIA